MELAIYEVFRGAGFEEKPAKDIASTLNTAIEQRFAVHSQHHATQDDIEKLRLELKAEVEKVRLEVEKVRGEIEKSKNDIIRWVIGTTLGGIAAALALARLFLT